MPRSDCTWFHRPALCAAVALSCTACQDPPPSPEARPIAVATAVTTTSSAAPTGVAPPASAPIASASAASSAADAGAPDAAAKDAGPKNDKPKDAGAKLAANDAGASAAMNDAGTKSDPADAGGPAEPAPAAGSADAVAAEIDKIFVGKPTFTARFTQDFTQKVSGNVKKSAGTIFVEKPNKISFRYDPPNKNRIVSDGTTLKVYVAEDSQMFLSPVQNTEYPGALSFIMGRGMRPSFTFTFNEKAKATFTAGPVLHGKPRSPTPHYESVFFYVDQALLTKGDPNVIRRVLILDAQGNRNRFDFEGASQPATIDPAEFTFSPPEGTNVTKN